MNNTLLGLFINHFANVINFFPSHNVFKKPAEKISFGSFSEILCNFMFGWTLYNGQISSIEPVLHKEIPNVDVL